MCKVLKFFLFQIILAFCLVIVGVASVPHHHISDNYLYKKDISNAIEDDHNTHALQNIQKKGQNQHPGLSLPLYIYKQVMTSNYGDVKSMTDVVRSIVKPILTSVEFQVLADFVDESLKLFKSDPQIKAMVRNGVDSIQEMYEAADDQMAKNLLTWMVTQYSDEVRFCTRLLASLLGISGEWKMSSRMDVMIEMFTESVWL